MSNVIPDVSLRLIGGLVQRPLEAAEGHVVMLGIETAHAHVGEDLSSVHTHLEQTPAHRGWGWGTWYICTLLVLVDSPHTYMHVLEC